MVSSEDLNSAFSNWGVEITRANAGQVAEKIPQPVARYVLSEVGIPERLGDSFFFHDFSRSCLTVGELLREVGGTEEPEVSHFIYLGSGVGGDTVLLDSLTGEIFSWKGGEVRRVASGLSNFVDLLYLIQVRMNDMEQLEEGENVELPDVFHRLLIDMSILDSAVGGAADYWRDLLESTF
ncbi:SUKH-4 family immunity protein [Streptomyces harbinensis]|uniref:SUKH-4 family immunity protein n=1 Tax=Streptomyces harbinensis TaxID=1176198 RepID=UPI0036CD0185